MIINFPWNNFNDIKFNDGEVLNHVTLNSHIKKIYDNGISFNNNPRIGTASTTGYGISSSLATSGEIVAGQIHDKCITTKTLSSIIDNIEVSPASFSTSSSTNITDTLICMHGEFTTYFGLSAPYVYKLYYNCGNAVFNTAPLMFTLSPICSSSPLSTDNINCYRYTGQNDTTDFNILSSQVTDYTDYSRYSHIVYYNKDNKIQSIKWCAIGEKNTSSNLTIPIAPVSFKFTGAEDSSFDKYNNYFPPSVPTSIDTVVIDDTALIMPAAGTLTCNSVTLNNINSTDPSIVNIGTGATINSITTFNNATNNGIISNAIFNNRSINGASGVITNATFNDLSENYGEILDTGIFNYGSINNNIVSNAIFNCPEIGGGATNYGIIDNAIFNDYAANLGIINENAIFNDESSNFFGTVATGTFNDLSYNGYGVDVATFNNNSRNTGYVTISAIFNDNSYNSYYYDQYAGYISFAIFNDNTINVGTVLSATFNDYSSNFASWFFSGNVTSAVYNPLNIGTVENPVWNYPTNTGIITTADIYWLQADNVLSGLITTANYLGYLP